MSIKNNCKDCRYLESDNQGWYNCYRRDIYRYYTFPFRYTSCRLFKKQTLLKRIVKYLRRRKMNNFYELCVLYYRKYEK